MDTNEKVFELLESTKTNWSIEKKQLFAKGEDETFSTVHPTDSYGIFRKDTKKWLGTVGERYVPLQNSEIALIMVEATRNIGMEVTRGGMLDGGRRVYYQVALPDKKIGNSNVLSWLSGMDSKDGSTSFGIGPTKVTVVCMNTFQLAMIDMQKFRHTTTLKERVAVATKGLQIAMEADNALTNNLKIMADTPVSKFPEAVETVMNRVFKITEENRKDLSTRRWNQINTFLASMKTSMSEQGDSLWAVFNGVTRYVNHVAAPVAPEERQTYLMTGGGSQISNIGYNELMKFVERNTERSKSFAV